MLMGLGSIDKLLPTSLLSAEELVLLCGFTPIVHAGSDSTRLDLQGFDGKVFVDIGAGFTGFLSYIEPFLKSKDVTLIEVDPIYREQHFGEGQESFVVTKRYLNDHRTRIMGCLEDYPYEQIHPILVAHSQHARKVLAGYGHETTKSTIKREFSTTDIETGSVDMVTINHVFYASNEPLQFLREVLRILKTTGRCIMVDYGRSDSEGIKKLLLCIGENSKREYENRVVLNLSYDELTSVIQKFGRFSH